MHAAATASSRVLTGKLTTVVSVFCPVSEQMSSLGVPLGGSEDWADRLFIEDKRGALLFSEEELDLAEEAQKRMEVRDHTEPDARARPIRTAAVAAHTALL
eukprot:6211204-Pleurochrysis_carterae.AAC.3